MGESANYRIGTYEGQPHFQCLLCPRDYLGDEELIRSHLIRDHSQEPQGKPDDRPAEEPETLPPAAAPGPVAAISTTSTETAEEEEATPAAEPGERSRRGSRAPGGRG